MICFSARTDVVWIDDTGDMAPYYGCRDALVCLNRVTKRWSEIIKKLDF